MMVIKCEKIKINFLLIIFTFIGFYVKQNCADEVNNHNNWVPENVQEIKRRLLNYGVGVGTESSLPRVKNVILFIGDGMGISTLTATRIYKGHQNNRAGESEKLIWDEFLALAHIKTYTANTQIGESAACATAMFTGVKANAEVVGFDSKTAVGTCNATRSNHQLTTIFDWAQQANMKTGFVTTTRVTHATPAALYAHVSNRYWEDDSKIPVTLRRYCKDIARQLLEGTPGRNINVILGGGRRSFMPVFTAGNHNNQTTKKAGRRLDARNLVYEWIREKQKNFKPSEYVTTRSEMMEISESTEHLLGLFSNSHLSFHTDRHRDAETKEHPTLAEMTDTAIRVLSKNNQVGFVLVVESGRIDHAHHHNNAYRALDETLALDEAVRTALNSSFIDLSETLIIVTADHGEGMVFSGYSTPYGSDIFGMDKQVSDVDQNFYPVLTYAAGPGQYSYQRQLHPKDTIQPSTVPKSWGNHGGEDVALYATGPLSSLLFSGTVDQTYISQAIAYALCISIHSERCKSLTDQPSDQPNGYEILDKISLTDQNASSTTENNETFSDFYNINFTNSINFVNQPNELSTNLTSKAASLNLFFNSALTLSQFIVFQIFITYTLLL